MLRSGNVAEAIEVIERWVQYRPRSLAALEQLAKAYEVSGDKETALATLRKAHELARSMESEDSGRFAKEIVRLEGEPGR